MHDMATYGNNIEDTRGLAASLKWYSFVNAQNFLVYHVPLCEWAERGLSCLEGMLSPKLYTRLVDLPDG
jgi:hypothetical protein